MTRRAQRAPGTDEGQAAVELALVLPLVALLLLALVQVALVVRDQVLVVHATREAAREAAVNTASGAPRSAALSGSGLAADRLTLSSTRTTTSPPRVEVRVDYRAATDVPLVGALVPDVTLSAKVVMRAEV